MPCFKSVLAENDSRFVSLPLRAQKGQKGLHLCCKKKRKKQEKKKVENKERSIGEEEKTTIVPLNTKRLI